MSTLDEISFVSAEDTIADLRDFEDLHDIQIDVGRWDGPKRAYILDKVRYLTGSI